MSLIFIIVLLASCMSTNKVSTTASPKDCYPINNNLQIEISSFSDFIDRLIAEKKNLDSNIISVEFKKDKEECFVVIGTTDIYNSELMEGYILFGNKMVVFYKSDNACASDLVNFNELKHRRLDGYNDQNSEEAQNIFDPFGRKFKIQKDNSLELVYEGFY
jgi:hypothetical protein